MSLSSLKISHFRTHKLSTIKPDNGPIVIFGLNGAGKTNVLEAISMFAPGQGFRRARFLELMRRPELVGWKIIAEFNILGSLYEIVTFWDETSGRKILVDGKVTKQSELAKLVRILWITPSMDRIWLNGSSERRRFLDRLVSNLVPEYTESSISYYKALKQRNKLIKDKIVDPYWYGAVEKQMAISGIEIFRARSEIISKIMVMQKKSISSFPIADLSLIGLSYSSVEEFRIALYENRKKEIYAGRTLIGPHLSDLEAVYMSKNIDAKNCSTGEQKALLISIIIATAKIQLEMFQTPPILLFDEISAHLDAKRRSVLYDELFSLDLQVFLTGTDISTFLDLKTRAKYYEVALNSDVSSCTLVGDAAF